MAAGRTTATAKRRKPAQKTPLVGVIMGSRSDWPTMKNAVDMLKALGVPYETRVVSAHRTPDRLAEYAKSAKDRMPGGIPVGTLAIGTPGAKNAGILAASIIALNDATVAGKLDAWRAKQTADVPDAPTGR